MQDRSSKSNPGLSKDHEYYSELSALAISGTLTDQEWSELKAHIAQCAECKVAVQEYRAIAGTGMALLMPDRPEDTSIHSTEAWSSDSAKRELFWRIARGEASTESRLRSDLELRRSQVKWWCPLFRPISQGVLGYAAAIILLITMTVSAYRMGVATNLRDAKAQVSSAGISRSSAQVNRLMEERTVLSTQINRRSDELQDVFEQLQRKTAEIKKWRALHATLAAELTQRNSAFDELQVKYGAVSAERDVIGRKLQESEAALRAVQQTYDNLRTQQAAELVHTASLETRVAELSIQLKQAEAMASQQQQFLASDRDIRELMGARNLYIADVYDVDRKGETQKPYGRVFYTSGKSLIFYAFDLNRQANLSNASTFQLWGRRGAAGKRPLNMGIFYLDSDTNKRWVLKFDDPAILAQIDAVFVTVEPKGGSEKPRGRQLLFASLRNVASNHP